MKLASPCSNKEQPCMTHFCEAPPRGSRVMPLFSDIIIYRKFVSQVFSVYIKPYIRATKLRSCRAINTDVRIHVLVHITNLQTVYEMSSPVSLCCLVGHLSTPQPFLTFEVSLE